MKKIVLIVLLSFGFFSCEKVLMPDVPASTPTQVFDELWEALNVGYVGFPKKAVNWDSVYNIYYPTIIDTMSDEDLYDTCVSMLKVLYDPNIMLDAGFQKFRYEDTATYAENFNYQLLERNYWKDAHYTGPFIHTVIDSVGYVYYGDFKEPLNEEHLDIVIQRFRFDEEVIGVIFDIRNNSEGEKVNNIFTMAKRMGVDTSFPITATIYKTIYKAGAERYDLTEPEASYIEQNDKTKFSNKFIMLTNRNVSGVGALMASAGSSYNNVKLYGDTTGGRTGRINGHVLPNGWVLNFPVSYHLTHDDLDIEDGIPPDEQIGMQAADEAQGKDTILEEALKEILKP